MTPFETVSKPASASVPIENSILTRLRGETEGIHRQIESRVNLLERASSIESYRWLLKTFYGLYRPFEAAILERQAALVPWLPDIANRTRLAALRLDLLAVGERAPDELPLAAVPALSSVAELLGSLYVLEGSTLGGQMIAGRLQQCLPDLAEEGCRFFLGYGAKTSLMWRKFREAMTVYSAAHPAQDEQIVAAAMNAFRTFDQWIACQQ